jgi:hypothetical protein
MEGPTLPLGLRNWITCLNPHEHGDDDDDDDETNILRNHSDMPKTFKN